MPDDDYTQNVIGAQILHNQIKEQQIEIDILHARLRGEKHEKDNGLFLPEEYDVSELARRLSEAQQQIAEFRDRHDSLSRENAELRAEIERMRPVVNIAVKTFKDGLKNTASEFIKVLNDYEATK